jgi:hypothetical protein
MIPSGRGRSRASALIALELADELRTAGSQRARASSSMSSTGTNVRCPKGPRVSRDSHTSRSRRWRLKALRRTCFHEPAATSSVETSGTVASAPSRRPAQAAVPAWPLVRRQISCRARTSSPFLAASLTAQPTLLLLAQLDTLGQRHSGHPMSVDRDVDASEDPDDQARQADSRQPAAAVRAGVLADEAVACECDVIDGR